MYRNGNCDDYSNSIIPGRRLVCGGAGSNLAAVVLAPGVDVPVGGQAERVMGAAGNRDNLHGLFHVTLPMQKKGWPQ